MGEVKFLAGIVTFALFTLAITGYAIHFAVDNGSALNINEDAQINKLSSQVEGNFTSFRSDSESGSISLMTSKIESGGDNMETGQAFKVGIVPMINTVKTITNTIKEKIFGGSAGFGIFLTALVSLLVYTGIRYIWKTWKGGNPD